MLRWEGDIELRQGRQTSDCVACMGLPSCLWSFCQDLVSAGSPRLLNISKATGSFGLPIPLQPAATRVGPEELGSQILKLSHFGLVACYFFSVMCLVAVEIPLLHSYFFFLFVFFFPREIQGRSKNKRREDTPEPRKEKKGTWLWEGVERK